ncbi:hypothetical protein NYY55_10400 [Acinetobacter pittii]
MYNDTPGDGWTLADNTLTDGTAMNRYSSGDSAQMWIQSMQLVQ